MVYYACRTIKWDYKLEAQNRKKWQIFSICIAIERGTVNIKKEPKGEVVQQGEWSTSLNCMATPAFFGQHWPEREITKKQGDGAIKWEKKIPAPEQ